MPKEALSGRNGPCPACGGKDRFRFDNDKGGGSFHCSGCGSGGSGWELLKRLHGWDFATAAKQVDAILGRGPLPADPVKPERSRADKLADCIKLWKAGSPVVAGDPVERYLSARQCRLPAEPDALRFVQLCPVPHEPGYRPAMVASVKGPDGKGVTLHRTFLRPDGAKADMDNPRATMPGELPDGAAVRLAPIAERLGIAEGIETALRAGERFDVPTWAALNATMLAKWKPPEGVSEVVVFGDNDAGFAGQAAAYALAKRLSVAGVKVRVRIPDQPGTDWADAA